MPSIGCCRVDVRLHMFALKEKELPKKHVFLKKSVYIPLEKGERVESTRNGMAAQRRVLWYFGYRYRGYLDIASLSFSPKIQKIDNFLSQFLKKPE